MFFNCLIVHCANSFPKNVIEVAFEKQELHEDNKNGR